MYTYIIIDDESLIRKGTIKKLSPLQENVRCAGEASNGLDGIKLIENQHPDFIILDMHMPIMDGTKLLPYLTQHYPDIPLIVISGYRDFDYINHAIKAKAIDYILKPFSRDDIQKATKDAIRKLQDTQSYQNLLLSEERTERNYYKYDIQMLQNLIMGYPTSSPTISSHRLSFINGSHGIILLTIHFSSSVEVKCIESFLSENGFEELAIYLPHINDPNLGFIILFISEKVPFSEKKLICQTAEDLEFWMAEHNITIIAGASQTHHCISELHIAYSEASVALDNQLLSAHESHLYFFNASHNHNSIEWNRQDEFLFRIESGMVDEVKQLIDELFELYYTIPECTLSDIKYHCTFLSGQCRQIISDYMEPPNIDNESSSMQNIVSHIFSVNELKKYYSQFFLNITKMLKAESIYAIEDTTEKIKIYIERNYQKNITQEFISCLFFLNRSYLSHLFKEKTGQKFVDYVNKVRIEKAKILLISSDRKMYQIAKAVGYDNVKYFFRIFKKHEKMTPEEYRRAHI